MNSRDIGNYFSYLGSRGIRFISVSEASASKEDAIPKAMPNLKTETLFPPFDDTKKFQNLEEIKDYIGDCKRCKLSELRHSIVFGEGNPNADLLFVGEGPGAEEDATGRPFVGKAGRLLTKIIEAMGITRKDVYIANIIKCRPPGNRNPMEDEIITCSPFLMYQISVIKPKLIVALGSPATCTLFNEKVKISAVRGKFYDWKDGIKLMPTFHPAYLLRNPKDKRLVWDDIQKVMDFLKLR